MSLDKSRIPKLVDSSRKFIPGKQRKAMTDPFVERITRTRNDNGETVSGRMVETRSQKSLEERKALVEVEIHPNQAMDEDQEVHGPEGRANRRLVSESTPVEQGQDFATSTGTLDKTMMAGGTEKQTTSSSFSERMRNTLGNIFPFTMGAGTGDEGESQEEEEDDEEQAKIGIQVSLNSSTQENEAYTYSGTGTIDQFGLVRTISKTTNTSGQSGDFKSMTNSEMRTGEYRNTGLSNAPADSEVDNEKTSRQRIKAQISTSTKLPGLDRVTPPLVTPLVETEHQLMKP